MYVLQFVMWYICFKDWGLDFGKGRVEFADYHEVLKL